MSERVCSMQPYGCQRLLPWYLPLVSNPWQVSVPETTSANKRLILPINTDRKGMRLPLVDFKMPWYKIMQRTKRRAMILAFATLNCFMISVEDLPRFVVTAGASFSDMATTWYFLFFRVWCAIVPTPDVFVLVQASLLLFKVSLPSTL